MKVVHDVLNLITRIERLQRRADQTVSNYGVMKAYGMLLDPETDTVIMKETGKRIWFHETRTKAAS